MSDIDQLDLRTDDQDRILSQLIFDTNFLQKCKRKGLTPELFASEARRTIAEFIWEYSEVYNTSPGEFISGIWTPNNGLKTNIRAEEVEEYYEFVGKLISIENTPADSKRLFDQLSNFIERRIIYTAINQLNKVKERADGSNIKLTEIIVETASALQIRTSLDKTEGILDDDVYISSPWLTRFGIPEIDDSYGGGMSNPNLVVIQGFTGRGKTWSVAHLIKMALRLGNDVVAFITEMHNSKFKQRLRMSMTGMSLREYYNNQKIARELIQKSMTRGAELHLINEDMKMMDGGFHIDTIKSIVEEIEDKTGKGQRLIILDSADDMEPPSSFIGYNTKQQDKSTSVYTWMRKYTQENDKCIITTSQSQRKSETLLWTTAANIGDDINKLRRSTLGISINAYKREMEAGYFRLLVNKNTFGPTMKAAWCKSNFEIGQFISEYAEIEQMNIQSYKQLLLSRGITLTNVDKDAG